MSAILFLLLMSQLGVSPKSTGLSAEWEMKDMPTIDFIFTVVSSAQKSQNTRDRTREPIEMSFAFV